MVSKLAAGACAWAVVVLAGGCGKAEGGAKPIPQSDLPRRFATVLCDSLAGCCESGGFPIDVAGCEAAYTAKITIQLAQALAPFVGYDAQAAADCLAHAARTRTQHCGDFDSDACRRIFVGTRALAEPCSSNRECAPVAGRSVHCASADGFSPEVCGINSGDLSRRGVAGDACGATCFAGDSCDFVSVPAQPGPDSGEGPAPSPRAACHQDDGLYCDDFGRCAPLLGSGAVCNSSAACGSMTFCHFDTGLCSPLQQDGSSCDSSDQCQSDTCGEEPGALADANGIVPRVCVPPTAVSAERCEQASIFNEPASAPAEPGTGGDAP